MTHPAPACGWTASCPPAPQHGDVVLHRSKQQGIVKSEQTSRSNQRKKISVCLPIPDASLPCATLIHSFILLLLCAVFCQITQQAEEPIKRERSPLRCREIQKPCPLTCFAGVGGGWGGVPWLPWHRQHANKSCQDNMWT